MSILLDKRAEYQAKFDALVGARKAEINAEVEALRVELEARLAEYRAELEAKPIDGLDDLLAVLDALNQVIAYEDEHAVAEAPVAEEPAPAVAEEPAPAVEEEPAPVEAPVADPTPAEEVAEIAKEVSEAERKIINLFHKA